MQKPRRADATCPVYAMSTNKDSSEHYDVAIIGSGLYGIQAARYYLEVHPEAKLVIFEADDVVGGVWSTSA